jgi:hypothetical protein
MGRTQDAGCSMQRTHPAHAQPRATTRTDAKHARTGVEMVASQTRRWWRGERGGARRRGARAIRENQAGRPRRKCRKLARVRRTTLVAMMLNSAISPMLRMKVMMPVHSPAKHIRAETAWGGGCAARRATTSGQQQQRLPERRTCGSTKAPLKGLQRSNPTSHRRARRRTHCLHLPMIKNAKQILLMADTCTARATGRGARTVSPTRHKTPKPSQAPTTPPHVAKRHSQSCRRSADPAKCQKVQRMLARPPRSGCSCTHERTPPGGARSHWSGPPKSPRGSSRLHPLPPLRPQARGGTRPRRLPKGSN